MTKIRLLGVVSPEVSRTTQTSKTNNPHIDIPFRTAKGMMSVNRPTSTVQNLEPVEHVQCLQNGFCETKIGPNIGTGR